jgi:hypothetical protein
MVVGIIKAPNPLLKIPEPGQIELALEELKTEYR